MLFGFIDPVKYPLGPLEEEHSIGASFDTLDCPSLTQETNKEGSRSNCVSPASSNGGVYSVRYFICKFIYIYCNQISYALLNFLCNRLSF